MMTRHPQELTDGLVRQVPRLVRAIEGRHGRKLVDCLTRRQLPECRRVLADLVRELSAMGWHEEQIAGDLDFSLEAVRAALKPPGATS